MSQISDKNRLYTINEKKEAERSHQKKIALINDFTGFGRCSLTVSIPIISAMKIQCCPVPTSILSNHTAYDSWFFEDFTDRMQPYIDEWKKLRLSFEGISTGFLGSEEQIQIVLRFLDDFKQEDTVVVVDPVMGDDGRPYSTYTSQMCSEMKRLAVRADILTPNLTEACILTGRDWHEGKWAIRQVVALAKELSEMGPDKIVVTGIPQGEFIANLCYERGMEPRFVRTHRVGTQRCGTGDVFASIIAADAVNGVMFRDSVRRASHFVRRCIQKSVEMDLPLTDGVCFEELLGLLCK
ncbi:MAG: pyridoxamine kinase [Lachnospiraceae bacterium]|nr:pyridoxamine kinase [Lachnospiraceae bacterium]